MSENKKHEKVTTEKQSFHESETVLKQSMKWCTQFIKIISSHKITGILKHFALAANKTQHHHQQQKPTNTILQAV